MVLPKISLAGGVLMGLLRLWLALVVMASHLHAFSGLPRYLQSYLAVQAFFAISGFYMQLLLPEGQRPRANDVAAFYVSRALRIYPLYFLALSIAVLWQLYFATSPFLAPGSPESVLRHGSGSTILYFLCANLLIFGQDLLRFTIYDPVSGHLHLALAPLSSQQFPDWGFFLNFVVQSWSLALELTFYVAAPFVLWRKTRVLIGIVAISCIMRAVCFAFGYNQNVNFVFAMFPFEIATFLAGCLAYRFYRKANPSASCLAAVIIGIVLAAYGYLYRDIPGMTIGSAKYWLFLIGVIAAMPFLFAASHKSKVDRFIGELSYPVYLLHVGIFQFIYTGMPTARWLVAPAILVVAVVATVCFQRPVDNARHRLAMALQGSRTHVATCHA